MSAGERAINAANAERRRLYADLLRGKVSVKEYVACVMRQVDEAYKRDSGRAGS